MSQSPILIYDSGGSIGIPGAPPISAVPVYSQAGTTQLVAGQAYVDVLFGSIQTNDEWVLVECIVVNEFDPTPLNIWPGIITDKTASGFRLQLNGMPDSGNYYLHWAVSGINIAPSPASTYYLTGPSSGGLGVAATFTVALPPSTTVSGSITVIPSDGGGVGGVFSPSSVTLTSSSASATFTYTPSSYGAKTISVTNSGTLINPANLTFTALASTYTLSGPSTGGTGVPSTNFTVALPVGGAVTGTVTVTPADGGGGGTFTPTTVGLTTGAPSATFTYTPASTGTKTLSVTNNGGLTNPGNISYVVTAPFDPSTVTGLKGWWKAEGLPLTDGASISSIPGWTDSSGGGFTLAGEGTFKTNILNGKPVVRMNGTTNSFLNNTDPVPSNYTVFVVAKAASISAGTHAIAYMAQLLLRRDADTLNHYHYTGSAFVNVAEASGIVAGAWNYITVNWDGANIHLWRNGVAKGSAAAVASASGSNISVGYDFSGPSSYWDGDFAEILVYNNALSGTDRGNVEAYLAAKYGL